jgi:hypothetical protein
MFTLLPVATVDPVLTLRSARRMPSFLLPVATINPVLTRQADSWIKDHVLPKAHTYFPPAKDQAFSLSVMGMVWPKASTGAAAFWNYRSDWIAGGPEYVVCPPPFLH